MVTIRSVLRITPKCGEGFFNPRELEVPQSFNVEVGPVEKIVVAGRVVYSRIGTVDPSSVFFGGYQFSLTWVEGLEERTSADILDTEVGEKAFNARCHVEEVK